MQKIIPNIYLLFVILLLFNCSNKSVEFIGVGPSLSPVAIPAPVVNTAEAVITITSGSNVGTLTLEEFQSGSLAVPLAGTTTDNFFIEITGSLQVVYFVFSSRRDLIRNVNGTSITEAEISSFFGQKKYLKVKASYKFLSKASTIDTTVKIISGNNVGTLDLEESQRGSLAVPLAGATTDNFSIEITGRPNIKYTVYRSRIDLIRKKNGTLVRKKEINNFLGQSKYLRITAGL